MDSLPAAVLLRAIRHAWGEQVLEDARATASGSEDTAVRTDIFTYLLNSVCNVHSQL